MGDCRLGMQLAVKFNSPVGLIGSNNHRWHSFTAGISCLTTDLFYLVHAIATRHRRWGHFFMLSIRHIHSFVRPDRSCCRDVSRTASAMSMKLQGILSYWPHLGPGYPLSAFAPPLSIHFLIFCSFLLFPLFLFSLALPIFVYCTSLPFLPESSHSVSRPEVVGVDQTWV